MARIQFFDTTLRDGEQSPGCSLSTPEKLQVAGQLARLGVDVIEAGFPAASPGDADAVVQIARTVEGPVVAGLARATRRDIETCAASVREAARGRIHVFLATSPIHMERKLQKTPAQVLQAIREHVAIAAGTGCEVEFSAEDAGRSDPYFLIDAYSVAAAAGATVLNVPDTVGYLMPDEYGALIRLLVDRVERPGQAIFSVHTHDDLGLAVANSLAGIAAGATQVECTVNGIGERAGNAALEEIVMALHVRAARWGHETGILTTELYRTSRLVSALTGSQVQPNKAIVGANAFSHEAGIHQDGILKGRETYEIMDAGLVGRQGENLVLGKHSGRAALRKALADLGYQLADEGIDRVFAEFKLLADRKKQILGADLAALVETGLAAPDEEAYSLEGFQVVGGTTVRPTATVRIRTNGVVREEAAVGDGPVEAAYRAVGRATGVPARLDDYSIRSVTPDADAQGEVQVRLGFGERSFVGRSVSTDIIEASVRAYLNALNRAVSQGVVAAPVSATVAA